MAMMNNSSSYLERTDTQKQFHFKNWWNRQFEGTTGPLIVVLLVLLVIWYGMAIKLNAPQFIDKMERGQTEWQMMDLVKDSFSQTRPILPAPHQVLTEMVNSILFVSPDSKRSLIYHAWVTLSSTLLGFAIGALLGIILAIGIVHVRALEKSLMPWVISSQTIPILAIAPMIIVVLAAIGIKGLIPKAVISMYLCFFPVTIGMVKGLRSPETFQLELLYSYNASSWQVLKWLRWPSSLAFLFISLKISIAASLVGAIVGELPTGASAGLGARLLAGSYYGQTIQIWAALFTAAILAATLVWLVGFIERIVMKRMGTQPLNSKSEIAV